jgi:hypothetical protein
MGASMDQLLRLLALLIVATLAQGAVSCAVSPKPGEAQNLSPVDFASEIEPLLSRYCFECHGTARAPKGRLRLNRREKALSGGRSGHPAIVPGNAAVSPLVLAIRGDDPSVWRPMPPNDVLSAAEITKIEQWINEGASFSK